MTADAGSAAASRIYPVPEKECDVIMKGGITSGVVFPLAIVELSKEYRFRNLGGTSAGGIAAAVAAAAEYNREGGGFDRIKAVPKELGDNLMKLFQPSPSVKPLFDILIAAIAKPKPGEKAKSKLITVPRAIIMAYKSWALIGILPGLLIFLFTWKLGWGWILFSLAITAVGLIGGLGLRLKRAVMSDLPDNNYGLCTGATQDKDAYGHTAVTEWLADTIDECAGLKAKDQPGGDPLTFGQLEHRTNGKPIILRMMTTNLSMKRPFRLPFQKESENIFLYRKSEFDKFFPARVMKYMAKVSPAFEMDGKIVDDYFHLPKGDDLPVIIATRMSLSFPVLFTVVPLYARDFTLKDTKAPPQPCLFSDGGMSNNFPIQFFDALWPGRPTFGISLDDYTRERDRHYDPISHPQETRVHMPQTPVGGSLLPVGKIDSLFAFFISILYSAKDWQDSLQSAQQGYRERIVHVALKPDEGGLNLEMPKKVIELISNYGALAGDTLIKEFDLDDHRWRRFLISMARLETTLFNLQDSYSKKPDGTFDTFLATYPPNAVHYKPDAAWLAEARRRVGTLMELSKQWRNNPLMDTGPIPKPPTDLRITPRP